MSYSTEQEEFWAGSFGDEYITRNQATEYLASNTAFFSKILNKATKIESIIEFGANIGMNLQALNLLLPNAELAGVEINETAVRQLKEVKNTKAYHSSILEFSSPQTFDLALIKGVLIHINPEQLKKVYSALYDASNKYICIAEYYNPTPTQITYRGHQDKLFKRDFAGEFMDMYPSVKLIDYGFSYHRDNNFPQDDLTWFLLKK